MRSHAPDDSVSNPHASNALDEFAVEDGERQTQPEPALPVSGALLQLAPADAPREGIQEPLSRIEAREAREAVRRKERRSSSKRFAIPVVAVRDRMTDACTSVKDRARRVSTAAVGRVAAVNKRSIDSGRRLALRMQRRAAASRARMVSERETIKTHAHHGVVALAQTLSSVTDRSSEATINLRRQAAASKKQMRLAFADLTHRATGAASGLSQRTAPLMREGRHAVHRFALLAWSSCVAATKSMAALSEHAWTFGSRRWTAESRAVAPPFAEPALEHQEFNGFVVAVVLAVAVVGYGGLLLVFSRTPADAPVRRVIAPVQAGEAQAMTALASPAMGDGAVIHASAASTPAVMRTIATDVEPRAAFTPSARTLTALWQRRDTRSLDRAFSTLRGETLALRSCGMRMTEIDRAVARCEGVTIDFKRTAGRWLIARVATR